VGGKEAPGLNEKDGRAGDRKAGFSSPIFIIEAALKGSIADRGRRPVAREKEEGAEEDDGRTGKTNGGFGGGFDRGDACGLGAPKSWEAISLIAGEPGRPSVAP